MNQLDMVKNNLCPLGHGELDECSRCVTCSANWVMVTPANGTYQFSGYGRNNGKIYVYDSNGDVVVHYKES